MTDYKVQCEVTIQANKDLVWKALTEPEIIKAYLFGTETVSDWKVGSPIQFKGEYEGTAYEDKGIIQKIEAGKILQYTYLSSFSGLEDQEENYQLITFELEAGTDNNTLLTLQQENIQNEQSKAHSEQSWSLVLGKMKELLEN